MKYPVNFEQALINNPSPRCPCMLLLDTSHSMSGAPIDELNRGVKQFINELKQDEIAAGSVELGVITFGEHVSEPQEMTAIEDITAVKTFTTYGRTPMGRAVETALDALEERKASYKAHAISYYQPWVVLMTDGAPTDEWQAAAERLLKLSAQGKVMVLCIGIGDHANMQVLKMFAKKNVFRLQGLKFNTFFSWLSQSMQRVSASNPGDGVKYPDAGGWASIA
ncbi:glycosyl transferase family 2 [Photobacterium gaetbulicola]|uniref:Glycosyl transferase family 2 n=1 Tax=Photobacterium gaetbulicola TaxID=1295392 RepID=A0A0B9H6S3_9GAMM|nr:VWA domain-containing protein [Photobacterium gaetbulicola]KHT64572.1 glycosyl transferase family 2 [Photobacterium gaetbulicola]